MGKKIDITGQTFGRMVAKYVAKTDARGRQFWWCECSCGEGKVIRGVDLRNGKTKSCGCLRNDRVRAARGTHLDSGTRLYRIWRAMRRRCSDKNQLSYTWYGGKGIIVCDEWDSYENFKSWAIAKGYEENLSIDRIDNDGDYTPDNCRWATNLTQGNNTTRNKKITFNGETLNISQWSRKLGGKGSLVANRIKLLGWSPDEAVSIPYGGKRLL